MNVSAIKNHLISYWFALTIVALVAAVIYSNIYHSPFVFDDKSQIVERMSIRHLENYLSLEQLLKPRAVVDLTFALNYKFGKLNVFGYHLVNVIIHILNGFIVYFLALIIFKQLSDPSIPKSSIMHPSNFQFSIFNSFNVLVRRPDLHRSSNPDPGSDVYCAEICFNGSDVLYGFGAFLFESEN